MKVLVNGGLNCSELDGWWAEAYTPEVGWALGDGREHGDDPAWDAAEAEALYTRLETEIVPAFYARDADGVPRGWLTRMRESMARLTPRFSTNRTEREYVEQHYLPAANAFQQRAADQCALGKRIVAWRQAVEQQWDQIGFGRLDVEAGGGQLTCGVEVLLHGIQPGAVGVELYADAIDSADPVRQEMTPVGPVAGTPGGYVYQATLSTTRPASDFTPRVIPHHADARIPLELSRIVWQR